ncbi:unnamed protein product [Mytilus coruscus]|uniref:MULE transposase domain-containing protein n=1 Tax=Mytilus coruscus TaxID=42192 RepID=A0A6J8DC23_MYTCO|nr:unnamed protein product [Mytilus coruscus]
MDTCDLFLPSRDTYDVLLSSMDTCDLLPPNRDTYDVLLSSVDTCDLLPPSRDTIEIRVGSDHNGGLTKALDSVFPNATRLLCTKHIKDNVSDHLKNKIGSNDKERIEVLDSIFGSTGLITAQDQDEFNEKATNISARYSNFNTYLQSRLKERLYEYVLKPRYQHQHVDL